MIYLNALSSFCSHSCTQIYIWILKPMSNYALFIWCYICVKRTPLPPLPPRTPTYKIYGLGFRLILQSRGAEKVGGARGRAPPWHSKMVCFWGFLGAKAPKTPQIGALRPPWKFPFLRPCLNQFLFWSFEAAHFLGTCPFLKHFLRYILIFLLILTRWLFFGK